MLNNDRIKYRRSIRRRVSNLYYIIVLGRFSFYFLYFRICFLPIYTVPGAGFPSSSLTQSPGDSWITLARAQRHGTYVVFFYYFVGFICAFFFSVVFHLPPCHVGGINIFRRSMAKVSRRFISTRWRQSYPPP